MRLPRRPGSTPKPCAITSAGACWLSLNGPDPGIGHTARMRCGWFGSSSAHNSGDRHAGRRFTLADIEELLQLAQGGPEGCEDAEAMARSRIAEMQHRIDELTAMRDALAQLVDTCRQPRAQRDCPILRAIETAAATTVPVEE